jgi:formate hydrogenlyase subunit 6/NADH:ubiquinone oxidoreductase subunit I
MRKKVIFTIPREAMESSVVQDLVRDFGLDVTILRANLEPDEGGRMVLVISGDKGVFEKAMAHVEPTGITTRLLEHDIRWHADLCVDCGACISICPTQALSLDRDAFKMRINFGHCIACGACVEICPTKAFSANF